MANATGRDRAKSGAAFVDSLRKEAQTTPHVRATQDALERVLTALERDIKYGRAL